MFLSWEDPAQPELAPPARPAAPPTAPAALHPPSQVAQVPPSPATAEVSRQAAPDLPPPAASPAASPAGSAAVRAGDDELLRALQRGLGMPNLQLPHGLAPETMLLIGLLLREAVQGTLDLLLARAMTKREIRAEVTMIVGRENNPLKFSPDVAVALTHLLAPQGRGFMAPAAAMRDAYDDLRAHTFGFMAGMRAALAGVLERFDPATLEGRLTEKTMLDSLLPMNRRAKLWDLFAERYKDISNEAEEDFHTLFGKAFLKAYEEQVARLEAGADGR
jgi:FHA domain-containing protein